MDSCDRRKLSVCSALLVLSIRYSIARAHSDDDYNDYNDDEDGTGPDTLMTKVLC